MDKDLNAQGAGQSTDPDDIHLPNARDVNRKLREERRKEKAASKQRQYGEGAHKKLLEEACALFPGNPQRQASYYLDHCVLLAGVGRRREVSEKTRSDYGATLKMLPALLRKLRRPVQNLSELGRAHVLAFTRHLEAEKQSEGSVQWRLSHLRRFFTLTGKPHVMPRGAEWKKILQDNGISAGTHGRKQVARQPKGWIDRGIDPYPIIEAMRQWDPIAASYCELSLEFGMRKMETLQSRPGESDMVTFLSIEHGAKGGKHRDVPFSTNPEKAERQRAALERAKELASKHPKGILAWPGPDLKQAMNRANYACRKFGITKKGLGVTTHGLRHQFGCDLLAELSGLPAPVLAAVPAAAYHQADQKKLKAARKAVARAMGHERIGITNAYAGSVPALEKDSAARLKGWLDAAARAGGAFVAANVEEAWIVGKCAFGLPLAAGEKLQISVRLAAAGVAGASLSLDIDRLREATASAMGIPVSISLNLDGIRPAEGAEILFSRD